MNIRASYFSARLSRSHQPADHNSLCCRPTTRLATSQKSYSVFLSRSHWTIPLSRRHCVPDFPWWQPSAPDSNPETYGSFDHHRSPVCGRHRARYRRGHPVRSVNASSARHPGSRHRRRPRHPRRPHAHPRPCRLEGPCWHELRQWRLARQCLQCIAHVYRPVQCLPRRFARAAAHTPVCRRTLHRNFYLSPFHPQLQSASRRPHCCRSYLRYVLSAHADVRSSQHSATIPSFHNCLLRDLCRRSREYRAFALRLVQRPSIVALDVLALRCDCAGDDDMCVLRHSADATAQEERPGPQLCWVPLSECRIGSAFCCPSARPATRLVALGRVQCLVLVRVFLSAVCTRPEATRSQPSRGATLSTEVEHHTTGLPALLVPVHALHNHYPGPTVAGHPRVGSRPNWTRDHLERSSPYTHRVYRCAFAVTQTRPTVALRHRPCLYRIRCLVELTVRQRVGGRELLPYR